MLKRLEDVCEISMGQAPNGDAYNDTGDGLPLIAGTGDFGDIYPKPKKFTREAPRVCQEGDIVLGIRASIGEKVIADGEYCLGRGVAVLRAKESIESRFLWHWLTQITPKLLSKARGATFLQVNKNDIGELEIKLPSLGEQRRIAAILDQAETLRTQRRTALALLDSLTQSLFLDMFGDPVTNPKGWSMSTIGDLAEVQGGLQVTSARKNLPVEVPYLRVANVYRGFLDLSEIKTIRATPAEIQRTTLVKNDLLLVEGHGNPNEIGRAALWNGEIEQCVHQNHLIRARFDCNKVEPVFASEYVNSPGGRQHLLRAGKSTSGLNTISVSNVRETPIALPPLAIQQNFTTRIQSIESLKATHRRALAALDELFASLQQRAFAGELVSASVAVHRAKPAHNVEDLRKLEASLGLEALIYVAKRTTGNNLYTALKTLYVADKRHLENHGRLIYGESYNALPKGPVPDAAYDTVKFLRGDQMFCALGESAARAALKLDGDQRLVPLRDADLTKLGTEAVQSLEAAIRYFANSNFGQVMTATHDTAYERTPKNQAIPMQYLIDMLSVEARQRHWNL